MFGTRIRPSSKFLSSGARIIISNLFYKNSYSNGIAAYSSRPRVGVTGIGVVTPLGIGVHHVWNKILQGESGIVSFCEDQYDGIPSKVAGLVPRGQEDGQFHAPSHLTKAELVTAETVTQFALVAAEEALSQAD